MSLYSRSVYRITKVVVSSTGLDCRVKALEVMRVVYAFNATKTSQRGLYLTLGSIGGGKAIQVIDVMHDFDSLSGIRSIIFRVSGPLSAVGGRTATHIV